ncbi:hyaluronan synthase HasA [Bacillus anthracis]|uniref:hyaluronan synthase HasA n=1 Tax=Bacillus anthracis TaxID=1392 RepID=UPI0005369728|nr:hyaluronan synthase HasA [Bacillus anthracis]KHA45933.1 hyaluronan synthase [Bacillus anthracis]UKX86807.1 glycosyltransferase [Bacillus anthracis]
MPFILLVFSLLIVAMYYINFTIRGSFSLFLGIYGTLMVIYLLGKQSLSFFYRPITGDKVPNMKVAVVVPSYNESASAIVNTINSVLAQDYPIHEIFFVDDGSKDKSAYEVALKMREELLRTQREIAATTKNICSEILGIPDLIVHRLPKNCGKRHAQLWAFKRTTADAIVTIDSDGDLFPNAVRELLKPFNDEKVMATTGHVNIRNRNDNLLTKLIDMRYDNAFRVERAAQSVTGNVLVCSGPLSCYRREVITENLEHYGSQMFLGEEVQFGDDRCLTNYAILKGKTVYQSTARCITDAPTTLKQFLKQQLRWNKSFFRESLISLGIGMKKPNVLVWTIFEISLWILFGLSLLLSIILKASHVGLILAVYYLGYISLAAYARNVFYLLKHPLTFLLAPLYGILHVLALLPIRFYALLTIKSNGWGTR